VSMSLSSFLSMSLSLSLSVSVSMSLPMDRDKDTDMDMDRDRKGTWTWTWKFSASNTHAMYWYSMWVVTVSREGVAVAVVAVADPRQVELSLGWTELSLEITQSGGLIEMMQRKKIQSLIGLLNRCPHRIASLEYLIGVPTYWFTRTSCLATDLLSWGSSRHPCWVPDVMSLAVNFCNHPPRNFGFKISVTSHLQRQPFGGVFGPLYRLNSHPHNDCCTPLSTMYLNRKQQSELLTKSHIHNAHTESLIKM
jgi:hypothetical protein